MNNKEVAHRWAHGQDATGSHFYASGGTLYSYGAHFHVARLITDPRTGAPAVLFTEREYSSSTGRHKSLARSACSHLPLFYVPDVAAVPAKLTRAAMERISERHQAQMRAGEELRRELEAKAVPRAAKMLARSPEIVAGWLAGTRHSLPRALNLPVMLRRIGDEMETSKGARVPIDDARRAFAFAIRRRAAGWHRNGETCAIGHYQLDAVNAAGIVAGCHRVSWAEAVRFANSQGWTSTEAAPWLDQATEAPAS